MPGFTSALLGLLVLGREPYDGPTSVVAAPPPEPIAADPGEADAVDPSSPAESRGTAVAAANVTTSAPLDPPAPASAAPWIAGGFVDTAYGINSNRPRNHIYRGTNTTPRTQEFTIPAAAAYVLHAPSKVPIRFELAVHAGAAVDTLYAPEPIPGGDDGRAAGADVWKHLALANVGVRADPTGTEFGAGLFGGPMGIGGFWSKDNWNYTPSWESNAAPFYVAGARVRQDVGIGYVEGWVVNGWQMLADGNEAPSYILGTSLGKHALNFATWVYFGPEHGPLRPEAFRVHSDTLVTYDTERFGVAAVWDFGQERRVDLPGEPQHVWTGGAVFARGRVWDREHLTLDLAARPEAWWDRDGVMFGADQWLMSGTGTATLDLYQRLQVRAEYRYDRSTRDGGYFYRREASADGAPGLGTDQHTVFIALVGYFERAFGAS